MPKSTNDNASTSWHHDKPAGIPRQPVPRRISTWIVVLVLWLVHWLPFRFVRLLATMLGTLLYLLPTSRKRIGLRNLELCFPEWSLQERRRCLHRHVIELVSMVLEYGYLWFSSPARLRKLMPIEGLEHLQALEGQAVILCMPHFAGLDFGGLRISMETPVVSMYSRQKSGDFDAWVEGRRLRFATGKIVSRQDGIRPALRALRQGYRFYYLPDQDFGTRDAVFVDFFGVQAATITGMSRMAHAARAKVVPCYPRRESWGYTLVIEPPMADFPTQDLSQDTRRMNALIERQILIRPEQYFWLHKRFKSRPPGQPGLY